MRAEQNVTAHPRNGLELFDPRPDAVYSLEAICHLTGVPRRTVLIYCRNGLIAPCKPDGQPLEFGEEAIYLVRRIETLRNVHGINLAGVRMVLGLVREVQKLREEMRFLG